MSNNRITIFARIRPTLCWEQKFNSVQVVNDAIGIAPPYNAKILKPIVNFHQFLTVFDEDNNNKDIYNGTVKRLCNHSITSNKNKDSIFMCYGQSTSGKTHTILGYKGNKGILNYSIEHLLNSDKVHNISIQIMESYGVDQNKKQSQNQIHTFDLISGQQNAGNGKVFASQNINKSRDLDTIIQKVRDNAHFAATARHPQSSRSHIVYVINIMRTDKQRSRFIIVDFAGSDARSVITKNFARKCQKTQLKLRRGEADTINYGLLRFERFIHKFRNNKQPQEYRNGEIRQLLHPYFYQGEKPKVSILFCFSPSITHITASRNTLKLVEYMADCHIIPERCSWKRPQQHLNDDIYHQIEMPWIKRGVEYQKWKEMAPEEREIEDEKISEIDNSEPQSPSKSASKSKIRSNRRRRPKRRFRRRWRRKFPPKSVSTIAENAQNDQDDEQEYVNQTKQRFDKILNDISLKIRRASTFRIHDHEHDKLKNRTTEAAVNELEEKIRKELAGMDNVDITKDEHINETIHELAEIKPIIDQVRESMIIKHDIDIAENPLLQIIDNAITFTENHEAQPNESANPLSKDGWNEEDEDEQLDIFNQFAAEIQDESDEEEIEHDFESLQEYKSDLELALKALSMDPYDPYNYEPLQSAPNDATDHDADRHEEDAQIWEEYDEEERAAIAAKHRMKSLQTRDTIQKELDALQLAVKSTSNRMSQVKHVPVTKLMQSRSRHISSYDFFGVDDSSEEINNESDPKKRFAAIAEEPEFDFEASEDKASEDIMVENLFWNDNAEEIDVDVEELQAKQLQLVKYENALRGSLALVRQKTQNMALEAEKSYYNDDVKYIEDELAKVMGELMGIGAQVNQLNLHNNQINEAMMKDFKRASIIEVQAAKSQQSQAQKQLMIEWHPQSYINENYIPKSIISPDINAEQQILAYPDLDPSKLARDTFGSIKKHSKPTYEETVFNAEEPDDIEIVPNPVTRSKTAQLKPSPAQKQAIARAKSMPASRDSHYPPAGFWGDESNRSSINTQSFSRRSSMKQSENVKEASSSQRITDHYPSANFYGNDNDESQRASLIQKDSITDRWLNGMKIQPQRGSFCSPKDFWKAVKSQSVDNLDLNEEQKRASMVVNAGNSRDASQATSQRQSNNEEIPMEYAQNRSVSAPNPIPSQSNAQRQSVKASTEHHELPQVVKVQRQSTDPVALKQASEQQKQRQASQLDIYAIPETEISKDKSAKSSVTFQKMPYSKRNYRKSYYNKAQRKNYKPGALSAYPEPSQSQTNPSQRESESQRPSYYPPKDFWKSNGNGSNSANHNEQRESHYPPAGFWGDDESESQRPSIIRRATDIGSQRDTVTNAESQRPSHYPPKNFWATNASKNNSSSQRQSHYPPKDFWKSNGNGSANNEQRQSHYPPKNFWATNASSNNNSSSQRPSYYPPANFFGGDESQRVSVAEQQVHTEYQRQIAAIREAEARKYSQFQKSQPQSQPQPTAAVYVPPGNMQMMQASNYQPIMGPVTFNQPTGWTKLYECNDNGNGIDGDLDTLLAHVNNGVEVRVMINNHYGWNASNVWISDGQLFVQNTQQMILRHPLSIGDGMNDFDILKCNPRQIYYEVVNTLGQRHVAKYVQGGKQCESKTRCNIKFFARY